MKSFVNEPNDECQRLGSHFDEKNDLFGNFSHHRNLLLDQLPSNLAHEIDRPGREIINKDLGYLNLIDHSQQNITQKDVPVNDSAFNNPYQQDKYGIILPLSECILTIFFTKYIKAHFLSNSQSQPSTLRGGMNCDGSVSFESVLNPHYSRLRLRNFRNDCYSNCAINSLLGIPNSKAAILDNCNETTNHQCLIYEIKKLSLYSDSIRNAREVKNRLRLCFPNKMQYSNENKSDASEAFFDVLSCLPNFEENFTITLKNQKNASMKLVGK